MSDELKFFAGLLGFIFGIFIFVAVASAGQVVIKERSYRQGFTYTLQGMKNEQDCRNAATRIANAKSSLRSNRQTGESINRKAIEFMCFDDDGVITDIGRILLIPWNGPMMCLKYGMWNGVDIRDSCHAFVLEPLFLKIDDSLNDYAEEWIRREGP